jgi:phosphoheptose isomerase
MFSESCKKHSKIYSALSLGEHNLVVESAKIAAQTLLGGGKLYTCGANLGVLLAKHLTWLLMWYETDNRPPLPSITLDNSASFEKQITALCSSKDILFAIASDGDDGNIISAVKASNRHRVKSISLVGTKGGALAGISDIVISFADATDTPVTNVTPLELYGIHLFTINTIYGMIIKTIFHSDLKLGS